MCRILEAPAHLTIQAAIVSCGAVVGTTTAAPADAPSAPPPTRTTIVSVPTLPSWRDRAKMK